MINRRTFLKGALAVPAVLAVPAIVESKVPKIIEEHTSYEFPDNFSGLLRVIPDFPCDKFGDSTTISVSEKRKVFNWDTEEVEISFGWESYDNKIPNLGIVQDNALAVPLFNTQELNIVFENKGILGTHWVTLSKDSLKRRFVRDNVMEVHLSEFIS